MPITLADLPPALIYGVALALGLAFGSFLNVVVHRLPRGENLAFPGSHCPSCGAAIRGYDNIPVLSWLLLGGRARCCKARISLRYPLVEMLGGLLALAIVSMKISGLPLDTSWYKALILFSLYLSLGLGLLALAFIDLEHMYLPDPITLGGTALGILSAGVRPEVGYSEALLGAGIGFVMIWLPFDVLYRLLRGHPGMGLGDAKLVMLAGAWFGWPGAVFVLFAGAVQGTLVAIAVFLARGKIDEPRAVQEEREAIMHALENADEDERRAILRELERDPIGHEPEPGLGKARIPFGPFLVLACLEFLLFGDLLQTDVWQWLLVA